MNERQDYIQIIKNAQKENRQRIYIRGLGRISKDYERCASMPIHKHEKIYKSTIE